jgi:predicted DCC family thiol-disulfide oxidoreductase YuxK
VCGFCNGAVRFIIRFDSKKSMRFAPLQGKFGVQLLRRHPYLQSVDSLILIEELKNSAERIHLRSGAALRVAAYLGGAWRLFALFSVIPRPVRDWLYDTFARYRHLLFGKYDACPLPANDVRQRFIE